MTGKFTAASAIAIIYMLVAVGFVRSDRGSNNGGFINLQGMMSLIMTLPVTASLECLGHKIDFRSNWQMGAAILFCGALLFGMSFGVLKFADFVWNWTPAHR
jgi:hypothetical protein